MIRSSLQIVGELRDGMVVAELSQAIHDATAAVREHGKKAVVTLDLTVATLRAGAEKLVEAPLVITAEVSSKLPQPDPEATIFFVDVDGNVSRIPESKQKDLGLKIAKGE